MEYNFRSKFIRDDLDKIKKGIRQLNEWEKSFYESVKGLDPNKLTKDQFNTLQEIAGNVR